MRETVAVVECDNYNLHNILTCIEKIFEYLEIDLSQLGKKGIIVKPNLLMEAKPEAAVTTHPAVVDSVVKILKRVNSDIIIGDSPGYNGSFDDLANTTGMKKISEANQVPLIDLGKAPTYPIKIKNISQEFPISQYVKNRYVISVPKAKVSRGVLLTCGVKNTFGCVAGEAKKQLHAYAREAAIFYSSLNEICKEVNPVLTIVDAVSIMEGNGPDAGEEAHLGLLFGGTNPFAVDVAVAISLGLNPLAIGNLRYHYDFPLAKDDEIELIGIKKERFPLYKPKLPHILSGNFLKWEPPRLD